MRNKVEVLIICDSHGTRWGCVGYANLIKEEGRNFNVTLLEYPGVKLKEVVEDVKSKQLCYYDVIVVGIGNPDVHSRMPFFLKKFFSFLNIPYRDSYFSVPPFYCFSFFLRLPFFLIRLALIRIFKESYLDKKEVIEILERLVIMLKKNARKVVVVPLFEVDEKVYGKFHNANVRYVNKRLSRDFPESFFQPEILDPKVYKEFYNIDFFHFKQEFHNRLTVDLNKTFVNI